MHSHPPKRPKKRWLSPSLLLVVSLLIITTTLAFVFEGTAGVVSGIEGGWHLLLSAVPLMLLGIGFAGMLQVLVPPSVVSKWMGDESGALGIVIGMVAGVSSPGSPHVTFPLARALINSGAGLGPVTGFVSSKDVGTFNRFFVWDIPFLGAPFSFARLIVNLVMAIIVAMLVPIVYRLLPARRRETAASGDAPETSRKEEA